MTDTPNTPRARGDRDAPHLTPVTPGEDARTILLNRVSWGAVLAGVAISLVAQLILNMLGAGVGLANLNPGTGDNPSAGAFSLGAGVWWAVSGIIAALIGGFTAGRLSGEPKESTAAWHGLMSWAVAALVVVYLLTSAIGSLMGGAMSAVTRAAPALAQAGTSPEMQEQLRSAGVDPSTLGQRTADAAHSVAADPQRAADAANRAAKGAATAAAVSAVALLLGAVASWFGGRAGAVKPTVTSPSLARSRETARPSGGVAGR